MLQGSLENFALDEVLGLLSSTAKTGRLELAGNRGSGWLSFSEGQLVGGAVSSTVNGTELEDVMFEMLRFTEGTFTFAGQNVEPGEHTQDVVTILTGAEHRLSDWRSIEAVIPTLAHRVAPVAVLPTDEVTISRSEWAVLTMIAAGCPAAEVCERLDLGEVEGSRQIMKLAERQLVTVGDPVNGSDPHRAAVPEGRHASAHDPSVHGHPDANHADSIGSISNHTDSTGYDSNGYDSNAFDSNGSESTGYDSNGLDSNGSDSYGSEPNGVGGEVLDPNMTPPDLVGNGYDTVTHGGDGYGTDAHGTGNGGYDQVPAPTADSSLVEPLTAEGDLAAPALGSLLGGPEDLSVPAAPVDGDQVPIGLVPPLPPPSSELAELRSDTDEEPGRDSGRGGILARYLKSDD